MSRYWTFFIDFRGVPLYLWIWIPVSLPKLGKFSAMICSNMLSGPLALLAHSGTSIIQKFSFWGCHLFPLTFPHGLLIVFFSFFLSFLPCHQLVFCVTHSFSTSLTLVVRTSSLDCISFNWFLILAWLDLNSAVKVSWILYAFFPEPPVAL